ncbi:MAG: hypothetical protein QMD12_00255 [Candidatus Aenigmarchaeota archaeon]|nr:hypothetical protein [Candidatus Aenigmarchaeota archaeon]
MKVIGLEDLADNFRVGLEDEFRKELSRIATEKIGRNTELAKILKCNTNTILNLKKGKSFTKIFHLRKFRDKLCDLE